MLWYCAYTYQAGITALEVNQRFVQQDEAGTNQPEKLRGFYSLVGGSAGFLIVEADNPEDVNRLLAPYTDLVDWDVRGIISIDYAAQVQRARQLTSA